MKLCNSVTDCLAQVCSATQVSLVVRKLPSHRDLLTLWNRASRWGTHDDLALMMTMTLRRSALSSDLSTSSTKVTSSVSERRREGGSTDTNWDINDPDIPARIDLHVSQNFDNFFGL